MNESDSWLAKGKKIRVQKKVGLIGMTLVIGFFSALAILVTNHSPRLDSDDCDIRLDPVKGSSNNVMADEKMACALSYLNRKSDLTDVGNISNFLSHKFSITFSQASMPLSPDGLHIELDNQFGIHIKVNKWKTLPSVKSVGLASIIINPLSCFRVEYISKIMPGGTYANERFEDDPHGHSIIQFPQIQYPGGIHIDKNVEYDPTTGCLKTIEFSERRSM